jgi:hypothetical protein
MSRSKKVVRKKAVQSGDRKVNPTVSRSRTKQKQENAFPMLFKRHNYLYMLIGVGLIALGMLLMMGGSMPSPDVWDENIIYSFRRTVLAPIVIIAGLAVEIYAIFK